MTDDGNFFYCTTNTGQQLKVFKNNGHGFDPFQVFDVPFIDKLCNSGDGGLVAVGGFRKFHIFEQSLDGMYF